MSNFLQLTEFENGKHNDSNFLLENQSLIVEFALLDRKIVKEWISTGLGLKVGLVSKELNHFGGIA